MKVLQINQVVSVTSTGRIVENLSNFLLENGHESFIAYSGRPKSISNSVLYQVSSALDSNLHAIGTRLFDTHGLHSKTVTRKFITWIKQTNPDIIHLHNILGYYLNYPLLFNYLVKSNKPVVWTFHDFWPVTGHCVYFTDVKCEKWKSQCFSCPKKNKYPSSIFVDNSKDNYMMKKQYFSALSNLNIVTISDWATGLIRQSFLGKKSIHKISNGIDSSRFTIIDINEKLLREKYGIGTQKVLMGLATTWGERKGYYDYLKLAENLPPDYQIVLIGLQGKFSENLPENIIPIKRTDSIDELVSLYNLAEITLNLSYQETFGLTTVEGLMCGIPGIVYNATASPELIEDTVGLVVETGDISGILKAIKIIEENGGRSAYRNKCREYAKEKFDSDLVHNEYLDLYKSLL
jgi:glycosyltransferase involved in cell wall biosynthesis